MAGQDGKTPVLRAAALAEPLGKYRDVQYVVEQGGRLFGAIHRADDQQAARAFVGDGGHRVGVGQMGGRQQRRQFRHGLRGIAAPAAGLPDIDELHGRDGAFGGGAQFPEQALFLRTGHHDIAFAAYGLLEGARFAAAQRGMQGQCFAQCLAQRFGRQRHCAIAVADECRHGLVPAVGTGSAADGSPAGESSGVGKAGAATPPASAAPFSMSGALARSGAGLACAPSARALAAQRASSSKKPKILDTAILRRADSGSGANCE
ncbi:hypothetical protein D9M68_629890 [compost metagenome]